MKIAISGPMGSGKSTIANMIKSNNPIMNMKYIHLVVKLKILHMIYFKWIKISKIDLY